MGPGRPSTAARALGGSPGWLGRTPGPSPGRPIMTSILLDIVLGVLLVSYGFTGHRQGFVVSVLSLIGVLSGGALGMWLLPVLLQRWHSVDDNVLARTVVLIFGVFVLASLGQAIAISLGSRLRHGLRVRPARVVDSILGAVATVLAVSVLLWFMAGAVRGGAPAPLAKAIGGSRIIQTVSYTHLRAHETVLD